MLRWNYLCSPILLIALLASLYSQQSVPWRDPSPHTVRFVTVEENVRLEVLDWGGTGRPVVLLAGGGPTAHVFDEFAPKLAANYRVYGITRRGFGASTYSPVENADRLGEDVLAVIRALKLNKPVLVGHSIAGAELSSVANLHPDSIAGVIYLEAAYPYAFDNGEGPTMKAFQDVQGSKGPNGPKPATPRESDLKSFKALQKWDARVWGFRRPESEYHQTWDSTSDGRPGKPRSFQGYQSFNTTLESNNKYTKIPVPALAIFAIPHVGSSKSAKSVDSAVSPLDVLAEKQAKAFEEGVPTARVVRLRGAHFIFLSNEAETLHEIRAFLAGLK